MNLLKTMLAGLGLLALTACSQFDIQDTVYKTNVNIGGFCSGTVLKSGHILTASHCMKEIDENTIVTLTEYDEDGNVKKVKRFKIKLLKFDLKHDAALYEAPGVVFDTGSVLSKHKLRLGDHIWCVGMPFGDNNQNYVNEGIISRLRDMVAKYRTVMTSCTTYPGMSGGAVYDDYGELVGFVDAGYVWVVMGPNAFPMVINKSGLNLIVPVSDLSDLLKGEI